MNSGAVDDGPRVAPLPPCLAGRFRAYPREFHALGIREYRETRFKPYRVIYRIMEKRVYIYVIADGRRDMQTLLERRLLGA